LLPASLPALFPVVKPRFLRYNNFVRLDLFLKTSRLIKRRSVARELCEAGRALVNGHEAKPGKEVKPGDVITLTFSSRVVELEVLGMPAPSRPHDPERVYRVIRENRLERTTPLWTDSPS
jgi:ribosomal 50S subunit-recycling heat shock protein